MGPDFFKVEFIGDGFLAVMAKPVPGDWLSDDIAALARAGIRRVVSLLESTEQHELGLDQEPSLCAEHELEFVSFPIKDRGPPASVSEFSTFTKSLYEAIRKGRNTVVHCRAGIGRTGIVAASMLLHGADDADAAFSKVSNARGIEVPDTEEQFDWVKVNEATIGRDK